MARVVNKVREAWKKLTNNTRNVQVGSSLEKPLDVNVSESATDNSVVEFITHGEEAYQVIETYYDSAQAVTDSGNDSIESISESAIEVRGSLEVVNINCDDDYVSSDLTEYHDMGLSPTEVQILAMEIKEKVDVQYPPFYDFCILSSEEDYESADSFKKYLCRTFDLSGCMLNDGFYRPGADIFSCFELMMSRSTKILFYLTESFTVNHFYRRLQSAAVFQSLMSHVRLNREKCVPVFPNGMGRYVPLPLVGIAGLCPLFESAFHLCVVNSFTYQVKERRRLLNLSNNESRRQLFQQELKLMIQEQVAIKPSREISLLDGQRALKNESTLPSGTEGNGDLVKAFNALPIASSEKSSLFQEVSALTEIASTNVQVTGSSNVHVGPQVIVNVIVNSSVGCDNENQNSGDSSGSE